MKQELKQRIFQSIGLAMGISTLVLNIITTLDPNRAITLLSIGVISLAISKLIHS